MSTAWWWRGLLFESVRSHRVVELVSSVKCQENLEFFNTITVVTIKGWGQFSRVEPKRNSQPRFF
jgi:hypothetical protein